MSSGSTSILIELTCDVRRMCKNEFLRPLNFKVSWVYRSSPCAIYRYKDKCIFSFSPHFSFWLATRLPNTTFALVRLICLIHPNGPSSLTPATMLSSVLCHSIPPSSKAQSSSLTTTSHCLLPNPAVLGNLPCIPILHFLLSSPSLSGWTQWPTKRPLPCPSPVHYICLGKPHFGGKTSQKYPSPDASHLWTSSSMTKEALQTWLSESSRDGKIILGGMNEHSMQLQVSLSSEDRGRRRSGREGWGLYDNGSRKAFEGREAAGLKDGGGGQKPRNASLKSGKSQETDSLLEAPETEWPCRHLDLSLVKLPSSFLPSKL